MIRCFTTSLLLCFSLVCLCTALIRPTGKLNATNDAVILATILQRPTVDVAALTTVLTRRSAAQRLAIARIKVRGAKYKSEMSIFDLHVKKLWRDTKFMDIVEPMLQPLSDLHNRHLSRDAFINPQETGTATEIFTTLSNADLKAVQKTIPLSSMPTYTSGLMKRLVKGAFSGRRNEAQEVDVNAAIIDAKVIHDVGEGKVRDLRTNGEERTVEDIFITRSHRQLRQICEEYNKLYDHGIEKAFEDRGWGNERGRIFLNMIEVFKSIPNYYAKRLYDALNRAKFYVVNFIIVSRSEVDLDEISDAFQTLYNSSLTSLIKKKTTCAYRHMLLGIVNS